MPKKPAPKRAKTSSKVAKTTVKKVKKELMSAEKQAEKTLKNVAKKAKKLPNKVKNYSAKKAKLDIKALYKEGIELLLRPRKLFESIRSTDNYEEPIIKAAAYGFVGAVLSTLIGLFKGQGIASLLKLIWIPATAVVMMFAIAGILLLISYIAKGKMDFEIAVKAVASKIFIYPIAIVLAAVSFTYPLLVFTSILVDFFILYLAYSAVVYCLGADLKRARIIFGVIGALMVLFYFTDFSIAWLMVRNPEVALGYHLEKTLGMKIDLNSLKGMMQ